MVQLKGNPVRVVERRRERWPALIRHMLGVKGAAFTEAQCLGVVIVAKVRIAEEQATASLSAERCAAADMVHIACDCRAAAGIITVPQYSVAYVAFMYVVIAYPLTHGCIPISAAGAHQE